jgi:hypothetical protein
MMRPMFALLGPVPAPWAVGLPYQAYLGRWHRLGKHSRVTAARFTTLPVRERGFFPPESSLCWAKLFYDLGAGTSNSVSQAVYGYTGAFFGLSCIAIPPST